MFTDSEHRLIEQCIADGYGTALFAISVRNTGRCTERQFLTLQRLHSAAEFRRGNSSRKSSHQTVLDAAFADYSEGGYF